MFCVYCLDSKRVVVIIHIIVSTKMVTSELKGPLRLSDEWTKCILFRSIENIKLTNTAAKIHLVYYTVTKADTDESREA